MLSVTLGPLGGVRNEQASHPSQFAQTEFPRTWDFEYETQKSEKTGTSWSPYLKVLLKGTWLHSVLN